jgi:hypothetical protein
MVFWSTALFILGVLAFLDSLFNYGEIFRQVNTFMFMLISLGVLIRLRAERKNYGKAKLIDSVKVKENKAEQVRTEKEKVEVG